MMPRTLFRRRFSFWCARRRPSCRARARQILARRLSGPHAALSTAAIAVLVSTEAASAAVPASLRATTVKAGALVAMGETAATVVSAKVAALTEGVLKAMLLTKLK